MHREDRDTAMLVATERRQADFVREYESRMSTRQNSVAAAADAGASGGVVVADAARVAAQWAREVGRRCRLTVFV